MECLPSGGWFPSGSALGKTILPLGDIPSGYPHCHGIFVCHMAMVDQNFAKSSNMNNLVLDLINNPHYNLASGKYRENYTLDGDG